MNSNEENNIVRPHLYLLKFKDNKHFKLGYSIANNFNRIKSHTYNYDIDIDESMLVSSDSSNYIKLLESNLLSSTNRVVFENSPYYGIDGYTEIRDNVELSDVIDMIDYFKDKWNLEISNLNTELEKYVIPTKEDKQNEKGIDLNILEDVFISENIKALHSLVNLIINNSDLTKSCKCICKYTGDDLVKINLTNTDIDLFMDIDCVFNFTYYEAESLIDPLFTVHIKKINLNPIIEYSENFILLTLNRYFKKEDHFYSDKINKHLDQMVEIYNKFIEKITK